MKVRTVGALTLRPSGNAQGTFYYMSLETGRRLHRRRCTPLPMPSNVIDRVHTLASKQKVPEGISFLRNDNSPFPTLSPPINNTRADITATSEGVNDVGDTVVSDNDSDNDNYEDARDGNESDTEEDSELIEDDTLADTPTAILEGVDGTESDTAEDSELPTAILEGVDGGTEGVVNNDSTTTTTNYDTSDPPTILNEILDDDNVNNTTNTNVEHDNIDDNTDTTSHFHAQGRPMRMNRRHVKDTNDGSPYIFTTQAQATKSALDGDTTVIAFLHAQTAYINSLSTLNEVNSAIQHAAEHLAFTQLGMKAGIKTWGQEGVDAIIKEMKQFHDREVVKPLLPSEISPTVKATALGYLMFLKKKRNGIIKGRGCADGRPQRLYKSKDETSSPTACIESIFLTAIVDAHEERDVAVVDIPGAFLQTKASDGTIIKLQGAVVNALLRINPTWK